MWHSNILDVHCVHSAEKGSILFARLNFIRMTDEGVFCYKNMLLNHLDFPMANPLSQDGLPILTRQIARQKTRLETTSLFGPNSILQLYFCFTCLF